MDTFSDDDLNQLTARGISPAEAKRQIERLRTPPPPTLVTRHCTVGDGIESIRPEEAEALLLRADALQREGRVSKFVPASGAATRMFKSLLAVYNGGKIDSREDLAAAESTPDIDDARRFFAELDKLPIYPALEEALRRAGHDAAGAPLRLVLETLLTPSGLGLADAPKGLIPFHRYDEVRTPLEEHLVEASQYGRDGEGRCKVIYSVAPAQADRFRQFIERVRPQWESRLGVRFDVRLTSQNPATDTLAITADGEPVREADGSLHLRPGGHGALLFNLSEIEGDVVFLKNIDNVVTDDGKETLGRWKRLLAGKLAELEAETHEWCRRLDEAYSPALAREAIAHLRESYSREIPESAEATSPEGINALLRRPIRVCGMVRNTGEPGGGPFWVKGSDGVESAQIVEASQIDLSRPEQANVLASATHFNPVDIVASLRDHLGRPFDLSKFVDPDAVFVSEKSLDGRDVRALEHPGLWNGAMAGWHTRFVEVPGETFAPVKSILDLLRPEHQ